MSSHRKLRGGRRAWAVVAALAVVAGQTPSARGWHQQGHALATRAALAAAGKQLPDFMVSGADAIVHGVTDPDLATHQQSTHLRDQERPEHYLDIELLGDKPLPETRYEFLGLCREKSLRPEEVGLLPYAIAEWTERLTLALAEHRKWPDNPHVRAKCLVYAGFLAHYAQDLCQPLHTTIHYDGRVAADGKSPHSGIHFLVDGLPTQLTLEPGKAAPGGEIRPLDRLLPGILEEFARSHALVDRVYALEPQLQGPKSAAGPTAEAADFGVERMRTSAKFTAVLLVTAWRDSAKIELPEWLIEARQSHQEQDSPSNAASGSRR